VRKIDDDTIESKSFKLQNPQAWIGFCRHTQPHRQATLRELSNYVCSVFLEPIEQEKNYGGKTPSEGCPSNVRGAVKITNKVILHQEGMDTYDRGFDENGNLVWGAQNEGYYYRWVDR
jgi:hypothetical protein